MLQVPLGEIEDPEVKQAAIDFCRMLRWRETDYAEYSLFNFLELAMNQNPQFISLDYLALPLVLDHKMAELREHGFYAVCRELKNNDVLEQYDSISLLAFLKNHFAYLWTKAKTTQIPAGHDITTRTILQQRRNAGP